MTPIPIGRRAESRRRCESKQRQGSVLSCPTRDRWQSGPRRPGPRREPARRLRVLGQSSLSRGRLPPRPSRRRRPDVHLGGPHRRSPHAPHREEQVQPGPLGGDQASRPAPVKSSSSYLLRHASVHSSIRSVQPRVGRESAIPFEYDDLVEAAGIEPASEAAYRTTSTSVVPVLFSPIRRLGTGLRTGQPQWMSRPAPKAPPDGEVACISVGSAPHDRGSGRRQTEA